MLKLSATVRPAEVLDGFVAGAPEVNWSDLVAECAPSILSLSKVEGNFKASHGCIKLRMNEQEMDKRQQIKETNLRPNSDRSLKGERNQTNSHAHILNTQESDRNEL